ncbi:MAG: hypothetical protein RR087_11005, partial [Oscillospiraceae bacterium]
AAADVRVYQNGVEVTEKYSVSLVAATLIIKGMPILITSGSGAKEYDGKALTETSAIAKPNFPKGYAPVYTFTGAQTEVGTSKNTFTYAFPQGVNGNNFDVTLKEGTLTVNPKKPPVPSEKPIEITVKADDAEKFYDGTPLKAAKGYTLTGKLSDGDRLVVTYGETEITNAGSAKVTPHAVVMHGEEDVSQYYNINCIAGTLKVKPRIVNITPISAEKAYDGTPLVANDVGYTYTKWDSNGNGFAEKDGFENVPLIGFITTPGRYTPKVDTSKVTFTKGTISTNYTIGVLSGTLTIIAKDITTGGRTITVTANSGSKTYDGTELTEKGYMANTKDLFEGDILQAVVSGTALNVSNTKENNKVVKATITHDGVDVSECYTIITKTGTLSILPIDITVEGNMQVFAFDNKAHTASGIKANGLAQGFKIGCDAAVATRTETGTTHMKLEIKSNFWVEDAKHNRVS